MTKIVTFEKIVGGGKALGYSDGKPCFAAGPLPGEVAEVEIIKEKAGFIEAAVVKLREPSARRTQPAEEHYMACSPWQNVDYEYQLELKRLVLEDAFRGNAAVNVAGIAPAPTKAGYRNKLEFSLTAAGGPLALAFHERGSYENLTPLPAGCRLGNAAMNAAALALVAAADRLKLGGYAETVTVRRSVATGKLLGHIALHQVPTKRDFAALQVPELDGVVVSRVRRRVDHELVWQAGETGLIEKLGGIELGYPFDSFFQTNIEMFEVVLGDIVKALPRDGRVVDLYCGVGTIGLVAAKFSQTVAGIEINPSAVAVANENAQRLGLTNYEAVCVPAQRLNPKLLGDTECVIVDPPRAGLEKRVVEQLLEAAPARIVYLSCNAVTQARDVQLLSEKYRPGPVTGYDMYPGTLHLESLIVLERI